MELDLSGKRALVTGSTLGIGRAIAECLISEGAEVVINSRDPDRVKAAVQELEGLVKSRGSVTGIVANLSSAEGVDALISEIPDIDILVNNAGFFEVKPFFEIGAAHFVNRGAIDFGKLAQKCFYAICPGRRDLHRIHGHAGTFG